MRSVHHHPGEDILMDHYRGALAPGLDLVVRTHVAACPHCQGDLNLFMRIGAALLEDLDGVALADNALDLALARIERPELEESPAPATIKHPAFLEGFELPDSLKSIVIKDRYWAAPGVWMAPVDVGPQAKNAKTYLMFVKAGMTMPQHTHQGREMTLCLHGHFRDHRGEYHPGDLTVCDQDDSHAPDIWDTDCLCLISQEQPIIPQTWLGKLLQPLARI